jgi:hypothetical protein
MRRCSIFCRLRSRPEASDDGADAHDDGEVVNEKRLRTPRDWLAVFSTVLRLLQFGYLAFAYHSLNAFQRSSYFDDGPWQRPPNEMRHSWRTMRWVRMQVR